MKPKIKMVRTPPTVPGHYWICWHDDRTPRQCEISFFKGNLCVRYLEPGSYRQPITPHLYFYSEACIDPEFDFSV